MEVYRLTGTFPEDERYGLVSQLRRASVSSSSNVAEGYGRNSRKDFVRFLWIALASLAEVDSLLSISQRLGLLTVEETRPVEQLHEEASRLTYALMQRPGR
jgi:four helix bundle protein